MGTRLKVVNCSIIKVPSMVYVKGLRQTNPYTGTLEVGLQSLFNIEVLNACQVSFWPSKKFLCFGGTSPKRALQSLHPSQ